MKVELINYTPNALELLLYTKNTRLQAGQTLQDIIDWPKEKKLEHLAYMRDTIKSSWEFCDYVFEISGVTRAFTHQLVRTRHGSYAQESQRTVDVRNAEIKKPNSARANWDCATESAMNYYEDFIDAGMPIQDARGILPINVCTSIIAKFSLRTLHEMGSVRLCTRVQGEYQDVFRAMKSAVVEVHPWAEDFIQVACVNTGVCIFPRYKECPVQSETYTADPHRPERITAIKTKFDSIRHEAVPVVKDGMTMGPGLYLSTKAKQKL